MSNSVEIKKLFAIAKGKKCERVEASHLRYLQIDDLRNNDNIKYTPTGLNHVLCSAKDIIIAWDGANAGTVGYGLEGAIGSTLAKLSPITDKVFSPYAGRFLQSKFRYLRDNCTGATIPHISRPSLLGLKIPLPPMEEQKKVAAILDAADKLRKKDVQLISKYNALSQSLFLEMFGGYIDTDLIPLKELVKFSQGQQFPLEEQLFEPKDGYSRFLRITDYTQGDDLRFVPDCHGSSHVKKDDIVIVRYGASAGFVGMNKEGVLANNLFKVNFDRNQFHQLFLFFVTAVRLSIDQAQLV